MLEDLPHNSIVESHHWKMHDTRMTRMKTIEIHVAASQTLFYSFKIKEEARLYSF